MGVISCRLHETYLVDRGLDPLKQEKQTRSYTLTPTWSWNNVWRCMSPVWSHGTLRVEFWDKLRGEEGEVCQCGFLNTTRFGPDVVLTTLYCHEDGLVEIPSLDEWVLFPNFSTWRSCRRFSNSYKHVSSVGCTHERRTAGSCFFGQLSYCWHLEYEDETWHPSPIPFTARTGDNLFTYNFIRFCLLKKKKPFVTGVNNNKQQWTVPLPPRGILYSAQVKMWKSTR
jgi:hypothetical protein